MPPPNIHDPILEVDVSDWERTGASMPVERIAERISQEDVLMRVGLARRILKRLKRDDCPPAMGIYGGWGTGKTSLLNLIKLCNVNSEGDAILVERIDAWKYEGTGNLFVPVIALLKKLAGNRMSDVNSWGECASRVLAVTSIAAVHGISKNLSGVGIDDIQKFYAELDEKSSRFRWEKLTDDISKIDTAFYELVEAALENSKSRKLVLCIDNLDRCSPENVVGLLESIKNFVGVSNCIWIFAMDAGVVASYINQKYAGTSMDGNSYLDKIIPEQFHLSLTPTRDGDQIIKLISIATRGEIILETADELPQIPRVLVPRRIIKSARKLIEASKSNLAGVDFKTVFALILLYHSWPDFYERLSSPDEKHITAIFAHFFKEKADVDWNGVVPLPLDEKFTTDLELTYFLRRTFPLYKEYPHSVIDETKNTLEGLRIIGLP